MSSNGSSQDPVDQSPGSDVKWIAAHKIKDGLDSKLVESIFSNSVCSCLASSFLRVVVHQGQSRVLG